MTIIRKIPTLNEDNRFPDRYQPASVAIAVQTVEDIAAGLPTVVSSEIDEQVGVHVTAASLSAADALSSKNAAATSAGTATTKAAEAVAYATNADTSAGLAATSEANAATSAGTATTQAGIATTKAGEAATSATSANTAKEAAQLAEVNAETAQGLAEDARDAAAQATLDALGSANAAAGSAGDSATSAGESLASAGLSDDYAAAAGLSAGAAAQSASDANVSAGAAAGSAGAASGSAGDAAGSAGAASDSAAAALLSKNAAGLSEGNAAGSAAAAAATLAGAVPKSLIDAKGDLIVGSANDTVARLAAAANGSVLVTDSAQASGLKYEGPTVFHKTTAQTLSTAEKTQALANLGVTPGTTVGAMPYVSDANGSIKTQPVVPLLVNKIANSDVSAGVGSWFGNASTVTASGGILTATANGTNLAPASAHPLTGGAMTIGNMYYTAVRSRGNGPVQSFRTYDGTASVIMSGTATPGVYATRSAAFVARGAFSSVYLYHYYVDAAASLNQTMDVDWVICIDLTATFGAGFEPSKDEMDKLMAQWGGWFADTDPKLLPSYVWSKRTQGAAVNMIVNGDLSNGATGWNTGGLTGVSVANWELSGTTPVNSMAPIISPKVQFPNFKAGDKIYSRLDTSVSAGVDGYLAVISANPSEQSAGLNGPSIADGVWRTFSGIQTSVGSLAGGDWSYVGAYFNSSTGGQVVKLRRAFMMNLTATFGAGNEPTKSEMDLLLTKYPNSWFNGTVNDLVKDFDKWNRRGTGSPEGVVTASPGVKWTDTAVTNGAKEWRKDTGMGNTGWVVTNGDTGWRDIAVWDSAGTFSKGALGANWSPRIGIAGGSISVRRINSTVYVAISQVKTVIAANTVAIATIPVGFTASSAIANHPSLIVKFSSGGAATVFGLRASLVKDDLFAYTLDDYIYRAKLEFVCDVAWPTSLP